MVQSWAPSTMARATSGTQNTYHIQSTSTREKNDMLPIPKRKKKILALWEAHWPVIHSKEITGFPLQTHSLRADLLDFQFQSYFFLFKHLFQFQSYFSILLLNINVTLKMIIFIYMPCWWNCRKHGCVFSTSVLLTQIPDSQQA